MIDHGRRPRLRVVFRNVPDRVQVIRLGPLYGFISPVVNILLGQDLIHCGAPQKALPEVHDLEKCRRIPDVCWL